MLGPMTQTNETIRSDAMNDVMQTSELLETILLQLPIRDLLLTTPLVCKAWQAAITASPRLRQALFLTPLKAKPLRFMRRKGAGVWAEDEQDQHAYTVLVNPFYTFLTKRLGYPSKPRGAFHEALMRPDASWQCMLLTQPASTRHEEAVTEGAIVAREQVGEERELVRLGSLLHEHRSYRWLDHMWMVAPYGTVHCKEVTYGWEVRRIVRPKAPWL